jgi:hypothetical protein
MFTPCVLIYLKTAFEVIASRVSSLYFNTSDFMALLLYSLTHLHIKDTKTKIRNIHSQKRNCAATVPILTFMFLCAMYIFPRLVCIFCCRKIGGPIVEIYNGSQTHECINWDSGRAVLFLGIHKSKFLCSVFPSID